MPVDVHHASTGMWWRVAVLVVAGLLTYANSLPNPFVLDDESTIVENEQIRDLGALSSVLSPERELTTAGRPVVNLTFAINYAIGGVNVAGYHVGNLAVHVLCAILLFGIVRRTLQLPGRGVALGERSTDLAFAAALLWLVHPLNSETINYVTQRTESLMALFYLLTLYASLRAVTTGGSTWPVMAVLSCGLGMACKESMVTAPVMVILFDRVFVFDSFRQAFQRRWRFYAGLAATWIILGGLMSTGPRRRSTGFSAGVTAWTYLLNQLPMITRYLGLVVWPGPLVANYGWPVPLSLREVLPYALFLASLFALTAGALGWRPRLGFLGAWFFITLAPTSSIVPIVTEVGAERRMYLPLAALLVLAVIGAALLWDVLKDRLPSIARYSKIVPVAAASLLAVTSTSLAARTVLRNHEYQSALALAEVTLERYPTPSAHHGLAEELLRTGNRTDAMAHLRQALPGAPRAHYTLGVELFKDRKLDEAIAGFRAFIQEQPYLVHVIEAYGYIGKASAMQEHWPEAVSAFREILKITPVNPTAEHSLAEALFAERAFDEAIVHYGAYLKTQANDSDALNHVGIALGSTGRLDDAIVAFRRAAEIDPRNGAVQRNLANALLATRTLDEALVHALQAVTLQPDDAGSRALVERIQSELGRR